MNKLTLMFILIIFVVQACKNGNEQVAIKEEIVHVKTTKLQEGIFSFPVLASGVLASKTEIKLSFKTGGIIANVMVDEGQTVKEGQVLAKLNLSEIEAQVRQAKSGFEKAKRDFERAKNLYSDSVATLEQYQNAQTALEVAKSQLLIAEFNLEYSVIKAPSSGKILKRLAQPNEIIGSGHPVFIFSSEKSDWVLRVHLSDRDIVKVNYNDSASISFDAFPQETFKAIITEKATASDPYTGSFELEISVLNPHNNFVNGLIGKAEITPKEKKPCQILPIEAIHDADEDLAYIYVAKGSSFEKRKITICKIRNNSVLIKDGVSKDDLIITDGADYLETGSKIKIVN
ncbi:MAG: efflux RND transporter periplasmic adaptor subunit [Bacteroidales bacterium]|nr:efflux RND transporter periplasmic adaptor subunit [Bacteroidales bacterium]